MPLAVSDRASGANLLSAPANVRQAKRKATAGDHAARAMHRDPEVQLTAKALIRCGDTILGTHRVNRQVADVASSSGTVQGQRAGAPGAVDRRAPARRPGR